MPRGKSSASEIKFKELDLKEAKRSFSRRSARGSKYDKVLDAIDKLGKGKALLIDQVSYSEVTGIRNKIRDYFEEDISVEATKVDQSKKLYDVLIHREG